MCETKMYGVKANGDVFTFKDFHEGCAWRADNPDLIRVRQHRFAGLMVSTVFLCWDHSHSIRASPPVLWETMVFGSNAKRLADLQDRYTSQEDAIAGHYTALADAMVWAKNLNPDLDLSAIEKDMKAKT